MSCLMHFFNNLFNDNNRRNRNGRDSRTSRESRRTAGNGSGSGSAVNDNVNTNVNANVNTNANGANTTSGNTDSNQQSRSQPQESENNNGNRGPFDRLAEAIFASQQGRAQGNTPSGGGAGGSVSAGGGGGGSQGGSQGGRGGSPWQQFEHLFQHAQAQAAAQASQQQQQHVDEPSRAPPPASTKAIRQLPLVSVTPSDLVDENNRECCICFDEHCIHDKVIRLPCAHIYHPHCITEWLTKHGTCPVCRYELPTDNVVYERERKRRMKAQGRKPRYARYELERMKVKQLKELCVRLDIVPMREIAGLERKEFMDVIMKSGKIIVIAAPDPIEYPNIQGLRDMGVGKLKRAMNDAGVFFDSRDVVEKEDMVQIFVNSGRIVFAEVEGDGEGEGEGEQDGVLDSDDVNMDGDNNNNLVKDPYGNVYGQAQSQGRDNNEKDDNDYDYDIDNAKDDEEDNAIVEQTKRARIDENGNDNSARSPFNESSRNDSNEVMDVVEDGGAGADVNAHTHDDTVQSIDTDADADADADEVATASMQVQEEISEEHAPLLSTDRESERECERERERERPDIAARETVIAEGGASSTATATTQQGGVSSTNYSSSSSSHTSVAGAAGSSQSEQTAAVTTETPSFAKRSIGELRQLADSLNVDISGCIEKREIIELISAVVCNNQ